MVLWLGLTFRRRPLSHWVCVGVFVHVLILIYGGCYTYARTPLGNWAKLAFHLSRNHYDRVGHVALGVFPVFLTREVLLRKTRARGFWLAFLSVCVVFAFAAFWELLEWWTTPRRLRRRRRVPGLARRYLGRPMGHVHGPPRRHRRATRRLTRPRALAGEGAVPVGVKVCNAAPALSGALGARAPLACGDFGEPVDQAALFPADREQPCSR